MRDPISTPVDSKKCPYCAEEIRAEATICRFCGRSVVEPPSGPRVGPARRAILTTLAVVAAAVIAVIVALAVTKKAGPSRFLYSDADKAYFVQWGSNGQGTLWATYIDPTNTFQVSSNSQPVTVTRQGSAVSIQVPGAATPVLGQREGHDLTLSVDSSNGFGPWIASGLSFSPASLAAYETAASKVQRNGATITSDASTYAAQDPADANGHTVSDADECVLYLSGTDVSVVMHGRDFQPTCSAMTDGFGDLGSGGTWSTTQVGENYPGQATLVCQYADTQGTEFAAINDAGGQMYGSAACSDFAHSRGWYQLR